MFHSRFHSRFRPMLRSIPCLVLIALASCRPTEPSSEPRATVRAQSAGFEALAQRARATFAGPRGRAPWQRSRLRCAR